MQTVSILLTVHYKNNFISYTRDAYLLMAEIIFYSNNEELLRLKAINRHIAVKPD